MIGRLHHTIIDCPDPGALAEFYSALLGKPITYRSDDFCVVAENSTTSGIGFQRVAEFHAPRWPDPRYPQQIHFDVMVNDVESAGAAVIALGASPLVGGDNVYADPVGHPFCLVKRPSWAPAIPDS
jgi:catechol 2,3-dioxygenase-like lactoylglutathione lyase family enzyme